MEYPTLYVKEKSRQMADAFLGYNHNLRIGDSEFYDMQNMTSDHYPVLAPRGRRGTFLTTNQASGLLAKNVMCYVKGTEFVIGRDRIEMGLSTEEADCPKELISMGAYVIIMPDRKYINTIKTGAEYEYGDIDAVFTTVADVAFQLCTITGDSYGPATISGVAPENPANNQMWIDTSTTPHTLKKYSTSNAMWVSVPTTYIKISSKNIGKAFKQPFPSVVIDKIESELSGEFIEPGTHFQFL
jgi:hypothetical protein